MKRIRKILAVCMLLCMGAAMQCAMAQRTVRGTVCDNSGNALAGATVTLKDHRTTGTTTGTDGRFALQLPHSNPCTLVVSYIGYTTAEYHIAKGGDKTVKVTLEEDDIALETVVVTGTRTPKLLKDAPIITRVITATDIQRTDVTHIGELLQNELPGVEFSYSMNQQVSLNMQGFGGNSVLFLVDGERLAGETLDNIDYSRLNLDNVERVEIVKGAASSLYGSNAVGGVVNIITREADKPWSINANARYGAHNDMRYGLSAGFKKGRVSSQTNIQYAGTDSYKVPGEGDYDTIFGGYNWNFKEKITYSPTDRLKLTGRLGYFFRQRNSAADEKDRYRDFSGGLKASYDFNEKNNLEAAYGFDQYDKSGYLVKNSLDIREYSNVQHTARAVFTSNFSGKNNVVAGGDFLRDYLTTYQFENGGHRCQYTADLFAQFDWNPSENFNIINGIRFDYFSDRELFHVTPKFGMMYKTGNCSLRGSYAGGFRAPTLKEMYMSFDMAGIFMIYGNPDLKPEQSHNFSLSAEYTKSRYNFTLTGYFNIVENRITTAWNNAMKGMVYTNMAPLKVTGIDANASVKYPCGVGARVSYTFTHEKIRKGEPMTSQTRPHTATARIDYGREWKRYGLNVSLSGRVLSKVTTDVYTSMTNYEETEKQTYPAYTMWKLTVSQSFLKGIKVNVTVDNLFNYVPDYFYNNSPSTTGTTFAVGLSVDADRLF